MLNCCVTETNEAVVRVQHVDDLGEVGKRARQPVDLVDDHGLDLAGLDVAEQTLQRWPLHRTAREAAIVIHFRYGRPTRRASG